MAATSNVKLLGVMLMFAELNSVQKNSKIAELNYVQKNSKVPPFDNDAKYDINSKSEARNTAPLSILRKFWKTQNFSYVCKSS